MKKHTITKVNLTGLFIFFYISGFSQTADISANSKTKCILQYLNSLTSLSSNKVISGQWMNFRSTQVVSPQNEFDTAITSINTTTSKWVGIIGTNYMRTFSNPYSIDVKSLGPVNQPLIDYSNQNGLITVMVSLKNPWTGGNSNDLTGSGNLLDLITNGHPANTTFLKELDSIAAGFQQLQDSGATVLFRPFHEMNGYWFWWGSKSTTLPSAVTFTTLWQYVFDYFTNTKNLHNILWLYTPSTRESWETNLAFKTELFYYPGNNYVDVIGLDTYSDTLDIPNYTSIVATGKPIGLAEFGPKKTTVTNTPFVYDYTTLIDQIKIKYPALCFWVSYNHFIVGQTSNWIYYSLSTQNNTTTLLNDSWVANRDEIDYTNCLTTSLHDQNIHEPSIFISPNPFSTQTILQTANIKDGTLTVYNCFGQTVKQMKNIFGQTIIFHRDNLPSGLYFIRLTQDNKKIPIEKLIITD